MNETPENNESPTAPDNTGVAFANAIFAQMRLADNDLTPARQFGILLSCISAPVEYALDLTNSIQPPDGFVLLKTGLDTAREYLSSIEDWVPVEAE